jgi:tRNA 2-thiouridine synthesizing protein A
LFRGRASHGARSPGRRLDLRRPIAADSCRRLAAGASGNLKSRATNRGDINVQFDKELDARGLSCPLPILKTKKALNDLTSGQVLKVVATDPGSVKDMQAFANQTGNPLVSSGEENKVFVFYLKKK